MTYQLIEDYTCSFTGGPMDPKGFAIHWWGDPAQKPTFYGTVNVLITRSDLQQASVNFVVEDGLVACLVDPFTIAWGQGDGTYGWGNNNLVSIECNPRCTAGDRETVAELIADQHIRNGIPITLYPHNNFTSTQCPGVWEQWIPWITERANQIVAEKSGTSLAVSGTVQSQEEDDEMPIILAKQPGDDRPDIWVGNGVIRRKIPNSQTLKDYIHLHNSGIQKLYKGGEVQQFENLEVIGEATR